MEAVGSSKKPVPLFARLHDITSQTQQPPNYICGATPLALFKRVLFPVHNALSIYKLESLNEGLEG
jgi:hypothetical protein